MIIVGQAGAKQPAADQNSKVKELIANGNYAEAEKLLHAQISDPSAPVTSEPAIQLEILRRTRQDFALSNDQVLADIKKSIPDVTQRDIDRWREAGDLQSRVIDGEIRYFQRSVSNLFRFNKEAKRRQVNPSTEKKFNLNGLIEKLVKLSESSDDPVIYPVKHRVRYEMAVHEGHPRVKPGARYARGCRFRRNIGSSRM